MSVRQLKNLLFKSAQLQQQIDREQGKFVPDKYRLLKLRELKLVISDKLYRLFSQNSRPVAVAVKTGRRNNSYQQRRPAWDC